ncbi:hypothetical protein M501DRAFT_871563 [Patellaria atrata CBS 101060]|uniref:Uncharacterized protein n=1 Tax=Patellaria atrata CBS 101060 TaxID=1346257 RepID=A0A9P4S954_9PEZI|nr:hypothetical protein M501DRAFT_871563 [Patellaria atrata CBS 101060]
MPAIIILSPSSIRSPTFPLIPIITISPPTPTTVKFRDPMSTTIAVAISHPEEVKSSYAADTETSHNTDLQPLPTVNIDPSAPEHTETSDLAKSEPSESEQRESSKHTDVQLTHPDDVVSSASSESQDFPRAVRTRATLKTKSMSTLTTQYPNDMLTVHL